MPRTREPRFDYAYLSTLNSSLDAPRELFYLSEAAQKVLSDLAEIVLWTRTRWYNGDEDEIRALAYAIYEELNVPLHLDDLIAAQNATTQAIIDYACCQPAAADLPAYRGEFVHSQPDEWLDSHAPPHQYTTGMPPAFLTNPLADYDNSGTVTATDYEVYLCDGATRLANALETTLRVLQFNAWASARQFVGAVLANMFPGRIDDLLIIGWEAVWELSEALAALLVGAPDSTTWDEIWAAWNGSVRQQVVCEVLNMWDESAGVFLAGADTTAADIKTLLIGLHSGSAVWSAWWSLWPIHRVLRHMIEGKEAYEGPLTAECSACSGNFTFDWQIPITTFEDGTTVRIIHDWNLVTYSAELGGGPGTPDGSEKGIRGNPRSTVAQYQARFDRVTVDDHAVPSVDPTDAIVVTRFACDLYVGSSYSPKSLTLAFFDDTDTLVESRDLLALYGTGWNTVSEDISLTLAGNVGNHRIVRIIADWQSNNDNGGPADWCYIDNATLYGDAA